jgi:hypothetical protein
MDFPTILIVSMLVLCYAAGILILSAGIRQIRTGFAARSWPSTDARLEKCRVESRSTNGGLAYHVAVKYSYALAGVTYTGDTLAIGYNGSSDRAAHESFRNDLLALERFTVRYDPAHPEVSTIYASENALVFGMFVVGLLWMTFTIGFTVAVLAFSGVGAAMLERLG